MLYATRFSYSKPNYVAFINPLSPNFLLTKGTQTCFVLGVGIIVS